MLNDLLALTLHHDVIPSPNSMSRQSETITLGKLLRHASEAPWPGQDSQRQRNGRRKQDFMSGLLNFILNYHRGIHWGAMSKMTDVA